MTEQPYDSRADTLAHIARVTELLIECQTELSYRSIVHDNSKLEEPEKSGFDACTVKLKNTVYDSPEYHAARAELKVALDHHYANNSHHPEHYEARRNERTVELRRCADEIDSSYLSQVDRIAMTTLRAVADQEEASLNGMDLFDVMEMLMDWKAATERMQNGGDIRKSLEANTDRFKIGPQLRTILSNTIERRGWK